MKEGFAGLVVDEAALAETYDELPLWSAPLGLALLETVRLQPGLTFLDVGCGTGFPLVELAQRIGRAGRGHGVDPWGAALVKARRKLEARALVTVQLHESVAESLPLATESIDLIVSNDGLGGVADLDRAFSECARVSRPGAQLIFTFHLPGTLQPVYDALEAVLVEGGDASAPARIAEHVRAHRRSVAFMRAALERAGFRVASVRESRFALRFSGSAALFEHGLVRAAFLPAWLALVPARRRGPTFREVEARLDAVAGARGELSLDVPFACVDAARA